VDFVLQATVDFILGFVWWTM